MVSILTQTDSTKAEVSVITSCAATKAATIVGPDFEPGLLLLLNDQALFGHVSLPLSDGFAGCPGNARKFPAPDPWSGYWAPLI